MFHGLSPGLPKSLKYLVKAPSKLVAYTEISLSAVLHD